MSTLIVKITLQKYAVPFKSKYEQIISEKFAKDNRGAGPVSTLYCL